MIATVLCDGVHGEYPAPPHPWLIRHGIVDKLTFNSDVP